VAETSIRDIAGAVGFSDGALYRRHYPSKDELVWSLFRASFESYAETLTRLAAERDRQPGQDRRHGAGILQSVRCDSRLFRFLLLVQHGQLARVTPEMANRWRLCAA